VLHYVVVDQTKVEFFGTDVLQVLQDSSLSDFLSLTDRSGATNVETKKL
jgi:hypothetical protein